MFKTPTLGVDTFSELVFIKLLNNVDIKCKKSSTEVMYRNMLRNKN